MATQRITLFKDEYEVIEDAKILLRQTLTEMTSYRRAYRMTSYRRAYRVHCMQNMTVKQWKHLLSELEAAQTYEEEQADSDDIGTTVFTDAIKALTNALGPENWDVL